MVGPVVRAALCMAFALSVGAGVGACGRGGARGAGVADGKGPLRVVVSIAPLKGLVEPLVPAIDGNAPEVSLLVPVGALEHGYEIPPEMVARVLTADVVVYVGLGMEPQLEKILRENPSRARLLVCFADELGIWADASNEGGSHDRAEETDNAAPGTDPHLWLDPHLVAKLIPAIRQAGETAARVRGHTISQAVTNELASRERLLVRRTVEVDDAYFKALGSLQERTVITAHAAWGRLCGRYGLAQVPLAGMEASEPSPAALARAAAVLREHPGATIFTEPQLAAGAARRLAEATGARVGVLDPLGDGDWFSMMETNLNSIKRGLSPKDAGADAPRSEHP